MWSNPKSSSVVVQSNLKRRPPYCANEECPWHEPERSRIEGKFHIHAKRKIARYPYVSIRFRCTLCGVTFADSIFTFSYRDRLGSTYEQIFDLLSKGWTKMDTARHLGHSLDTVLRRSRKLARQAILQQSIRMKGVKIDEPIAYDGIENFAFSQYDPNNINHAVGKNTYFIYDFNLSPMNRKGRMSSYQQRKKARLENRFGKYPSRAIEFDSERLFKRLMTNASGELILHTDNHYAYRRALARLRSRHRFTHVITPAKVARNHRNKLFAINHTDSLTRQKTTAFKRETLSFAKHAIAMQEVFAIFMARKNFLRPIFEKPHVRDPIAHKESPAMRLGLTKKILTFHEFFRVRVTKSQASPHEDWRGLIERVDPNSRRPVLTYSGL